eukprot:7307429-Alexandrium_andersonii.AAC.1
MLDLASRAPRAKDCADCGLADCGLESVTLRVRDFGPPSRPSFVGRFGLCARNAAECNPLGSFRGQL